MKRKPLKKNPCKIKVQIPKSADVEDVGSAVEEALKTKLTDAIVKSCKEITITITKFGHSEL